MRLGRCHVGWLLPPLLSSSCFDLFAARYRRRTSKIRISAWYPHNQHMMRPRIWISKEDSTPPDRSACAMVPRQDRLLPMVRLRADRVKARQCAHYSFILFSQKNRTKSESKSKVELELERPATISMKTTALAFVLIAALSAGSFAAETSLRGIHERNLKKEKAAKDDGGAKTPKPPKNGGANDDTNRAGVDDGTCCNGPAGPQPATGPGNRAPSNCPDLGRQLPVYSIQKGSQEYIDGIPQENACSCNDQCAFQDGTSMVCCLQSHYFVDVNRHPISVCVDTTGLNESVMNGCLVGGNGGDGGEVPVLRSSVASGSAYSDPLDYDLMGVRR